MNRPYTHSPGPSLQFVAYVDSEGALTVTPFHSYERYCQLLRRSDIVQLERFAAAGYVEARREARRRLGHLEKEQSLAHLFGPPGRPTGREARDG